MAKRSTSVSCDVEYQVRLLVRNWEEDGHQREWWIGKMYRSQAVPRKNRLRPLPVIGPKVVSSIEESVRLVPIVNCASSPITANDSWDLTQNHGWILLEEVT